MKRAAWLIGSALIASSTIVLAQGSPESLLPPGFDDPAPAPAPSPTPAPRPSAAPAPTQPQPGSSGPTGPVVQPLPGAGQGGEAPATPIAKNATTRASRSPALSNASIR